MIKQDNILIIEPDQEKRTELSDIVASLGHNQHIAKSSEQAYRAVLGCAARGNPIALVILNQDGDTTDDSSSRDDGFSIYDRLVKSREENGSGYKGQFLIRESKMGGCEAYRRTERWTAKGVSNFLAGNASRDQIRYMIESIVPHGVARGGEYNTTMSYNHDLSSYRLETKLALTEPISEIFGERDVRQHTQVLLITEVDSRTGKVETYVATEQYRNCHLKGYHLETAVGKEDPLKLHFGMLRHLTNPRKYAKPIISQPTAQDISFDGFDADNGPEDFARKRTDAVLD